MIRFEKDARTVGEIVVLQNMLDGEGLHNPDWRDLEPCDFAHDLHGQIFRHVLIVDEERRLRHGPQVDIGSVFGSMVAEHAHPRVRGCGVQGVAAYLTMLTSGWPTDIEVRCIGVHTFHAAYCEQLAARRKAARESARSGAR